jgi:epsilon-lactone hydrolase
MAPSVMNQIAIAVLRLQGRKRRWRDGARLVDTARAHNAHGPVAPPAWLPKRVQLSTDAAAGFPVHRLAPLVETPVSTTVLFLHGGGYIHDFASQHWTFMTSIVEGTGATVIAPQYPLAPAHTWRDSFEQVLGLARDADVLIGDSAGGGYALAIGQALAAEGIARDLVLSAPLVDLTLSSAKTAEYDADDPWLAADGIRHAGAAWAGEDDPGASELSPLFGDFSGLGRVLVFTGTRDVLHPQSRQLARRMPAAEIVTERGSVHNYPLLPTPEARRALHRIEDFIRPGDDVSAT